MGGALAQLCAYDLTHSRDFAAASRRCPAHRLISLNGLLGIAVPPCQASSAAPLTVVAFAAPRLFNAAFRRRRDEVVSPPPPPLSRISPYLAYRRRMDEVEAVGRLRALRVVCAADIIARVPPRSVGGSHGVSSRLAIHASRRGGATRLSGPGFTLRRDDPHDAELWRVLPADAHCCHALYLRGEATRAVAVPLDAPWPFGEGAGGEAEAGGEGRSSSRGGAAEQRDSELDFGLGQQLGQQAASWLSWFARRVGGSAGEDGSGGEGSSAGQGESKE